jgi:hypothetical protein
MGGRLYSDAAVVVVVAAAAACGCTSHASSLRRHNDNLRAGDPLHSARFKCERVRGAEAPAEAPAAARCRRRRGARIRSARSRRGDTKRGRSPGRCPNRDMPHGVRGGLSRPGSKSLFRGRSCQTPLHASQPVVVSRPHVPASRYDRAKRAVLPPPRKTRLMADRADVGNRRRYPLGLYRTVPDSVRLLNERPPPAACRSTLGLRSKSRFMQLRALPFRWTVSRFRPWLQLLTFAKSIHLRPPIRHKAA